MAPYRAFMPGQRDKSAETGQRMTQYIEDWDKRWKEMAGGHNNCDNLPMTIKSIHRFC